MLKSNLLFDLYAGVECFEANRFRSFEIFIEVFGDFGEN